MSQLLSVSVDRGLLFVRAALGIVFVAHGWQKLTVYGVSGVATGFEQMGFPVPMVNAVIITAVELGGGLLLLAGAGTRVVAALLAFSMFIATVVAHGSGGFFLPTGYEPRRACCLKALNMEFRGEPWRRAISERRTGWPAPASPGPREGRETTNEYSAPFTNGAFICGLSPSAKPPLAAGQPSPPWISMALHVEKRPF
jgi:putative oxidoreductase